MASVCFGTVAPVMTPAAGFSASAGRRRSRAPFLRHVPDATKSVAAAALKEEKGFVDFVFGALYKEDQLLETDPLLNKVEGKASAASGTTVSRKAAAPAKKAGDDGAGGFNFGGFFAKKG